MVGPPEGGVGGAPEKGAGGGWGVPRKVRERGRKAPLANRNKITPRKVLLYWGGGNYNYPAKGRMQVS